MPLELSKQMLRRTPHSHNRGRILSTNNSLYHVYSHVITYYRSYSSTWPRMIFIFTTPIQQPVALLHQPCSLSFYRSRVSAKARSPQRVMHCFLFQFPVFSRFFKVIQQLVTSSSSSSSHFYAFLYLSFNNMLQKAVPTQYLVDTVNILSF